MIINIKVEIITMQINRTCDKSFIITSRFITIVGIIIILKVRYLSRTLECGEIFVLDGRNGRPFRKENGTAKITVFFGPAVARFRAELVPKELRNFPWLNLSLSRVGSSAKV